MKKLIEAFRRMVGEIRPSRLILTLLYFACMFACGWYAQTHEGRYQRGFSIILLIVFIILFVRSVKKLLSPAIQELIEDFLENVLAVVFFPITWSVRKIAKFLGIGRWAGWGEDERTFIWKDREKQTRRRRRLKNDQKWAEQEDNRRRVRYLYIEYMLKRVRSGYTIRRQMTPDEIAADLILEEEEKVIFSTYDKARYAKDPEISDQTVGLIMALTKRRQEIRKERFE